MNKYRLPDYLNDMERAAAKACTYVAGLSWDDFHSNELVQDGVIRQISIIGEASARILHKYEGFTQTHADIQWKDIRGMRDILIHDYGHVDLETVWDTARNFLPELLRQLPGLKQDAESRAPGRGLSSS